MKWEGALTEKARQHGVNGVQPSPSKNTCTFFQDIPINTTHARSKLIRHCDENVRSVLCAYHQITESACESSFPFTRKASVVASPRLDKLVSLLLSDIVTKTYDWCSVRTIRSQKVLVRVHSLLQRRLRLWQAQG